MSTRPPRVRGSRFLRILPACLALLFLFASSVPAQTRPDAREPQSVLDSARLIELTTAPDDLVPAPPGAGRIGEVREPIAPPELGKFPGDQLGGDDVLVAGPANSDLIRMACDDEGRLFIAATDYVSGQGSWIRIYRSVDGGDTWPLWGNIGNTNPLNSFDNPVLCASGGVNRRLFLMYATIVSGSDTILRVASADPTAASAVWNSQVAFSAPGVDFLHGDLVTDSVNFSSYWVYAVAQGDDGNGDDIWFNRSTDQGGSWQTSYQIASLALGDRDYKTPRIDYGLSGGIHVAWYFDPDVVGWDRAVRYRRATGYANTGIASWEPIIFISTAFDGTHDYKPWVCASDDSGDVMLGYSRLSTSSVLQPGKIQLSTDSGDSWPASQQDDLPAVFSGVTAEVDGGWITVLEQGYRDLMYRSPETNPLAMSDMLLYQDASSNDGVVGGWVTCAVDPTRPGNVAWAWQMRDTDPSSDPDNIWFDATWRDSPGYPNLEPGFPLALDHQPHTAPAVVDVDGDPELEIVYGDADGWVHVVDPDGSNLPGWPVDVGSIDAGAPTAIADLNGDGRVEIVTGTADGWVYAHGPDGEVQPGWPVHVGMGEAYVSIGPLGPPYPHWVVAGCDRQIYVLDYAGRIRQGFPWTFGQDISAPAAIGDVDNDGTVEIVSVKGEWVHVQNPSSATPESYRRFVGKNILQPASIGDVDWDQDYEIAVPTFQGDVYLMEHDLTDRTPWPFTDPDGYPTSSVALANTIGNWELDLAFAQQNWKVHHLWFDMDEALGWPHETTSGWWIFGAPIIEVTDAGSPDVLVGARDGVGYGWENAYFKVPGWPRELDAQCELPAAAGDIDADGRLEVVFLNMTNMVIFDVGEYDEPWDHDRGRWPMFMNDARRSGCNDCDGPQATGTPPPLTEGVVFGRPRPNPSAGETEFAFRLVSPSHVQLIVHDVRGRRVASPVDARFEAGVWTEGWDGKDHRGASLASGVYFAQLRIEPENGPARTFQRKLVMTR